MNLLTVQVGRVCAEEADRQREHRQTGARHARNHDVVYSASLEEHFDGLERNDEAEHGEHRELAVHVSHRDVGEVHAGVDADEVEQLVEDGRDAEVAQDEEAAGDEHREHRNVGVAREDVAEEQRADPVRRVGLRVGEVAADDLANFEDVHEQEEHADVRERERTVGFDDREREVDVGGRRGLHEDLEARQQRAEHGARRRRARAHDERDEQREHARAVDVQQALDGVGEDVEEDICIKILFLCSILSNSLMPSGNFAKKKLATGSPSLTFSRL